MKYILITVNGITEDVANIYVFAIRTGNVHKGMSVHSLKFWDNETLIRDFVPCYRKSDNEVGLYDMVNNKFYTNTGTGTFSVGDELDNQYHGEKIQEFVYGTAQNLYENVYTRDEYRFKGWNTNPDGSGTLYTEGQEVNNLSTVDGEVINLYAQWESNVYMVNFWQNCGIPKEYKELEYIQSTGTQYIDTGVIPSNNLKTEILYTDTTATGSNYVLGSRAGTGNQNEIIYAITGTYANKEVSLAFMNLTTVTKESDDQILVDTRTKNSKYHINLEIEQDAEYGYRMYGHVDNLTDNTSKDAYSNYIQNGIDNIYPSIGVFGFSAKYIHKGMQLYSLKFWEEDTLIRDYIPVYKIVNDEEVVGLYDLIENKFYENSGTGIFTKGSEVKTSQKISYGQTQILNLNTYTKEGYTFVGWNTEPDGSGVVYVDGAEFVDNGRYNNDEINLYAQWEINELVVDEGEENTESNSISDEETSELEVAETLENTVEHNSDEIKENETLTEDEISSQEEI